MPTLQPVLVNYNNYYLSIILTRMLLQHRYEIILFSNYFITV